MTDIKDVLIRYENEHLNSISQEHVVLKLTETDTRDLQIFLNYRVSLGNKEMKVEELYSAKLNQNDLLNLR